jgi:hypothetical protein
VAVLAPGALIIAFGFSNGGYFPGAVAVVSTLLVAGLVLHLTVADRPLAGLGALPLVGLAALALLALWTLASGSWSDAGGRALLEYDRALLYVLAFAAFAMLGSSPERLRWLVRGLLAGIVVVCVSGLISRTLPDVWSVTPSIANDRLSYPLGYWNALGLLTALGILLSVALTTDAREARVTRALAAAALPLLAATLLLTFSRASIALTIAAVPLLLVLGRPRALLGGLLAAAPATAVALVVAYDADLVASDRPTSAAATAQGHDLALVLVLCAVVAGGARWLLTRSDARLDAAIPRPRLPAAARRPGLLAGAAAGIVVVLAAIAIAAGAPGELSDQYDRFVEGNRVQETDGDLRTRLTQVGNNGRIQQWRVARDAFSDEPLRGTGAGTYALQWDHDRPEYYQVRDAHSLYLEVLGELGIVGLLLLVAALLAVLVAFAVRTRGPDRMLGAALLTCGLVWAVHAGVDWDWEMPAVTLWLFAAGGLAAAAPAGVRRHGLRGADLPGAARVVAGLGVLLLAIVPVRIWLSEHALRDSARAFDAGDCPRAIDRALDSTAALGDRPEPFVLLGYCDVRIGQPQLAIRAMTRAISEDPGNWQPHYGLALVRASAGQDPRPAIRVARRLNPLEDLPRQAEERFDTNDPRTWRRRAKEARLP